MLNVRAVASALAMIALAAVARAQPAPPPGPTQAKRDRAKALFEQSESLYREEKYRAAAERLRQAYDLVQEPVLLYNLGRALERGGEYTSAVTAYSAYLRDDPGTRDRKAIEARIAALRNRPDEAEAVRGQAETEQTGQPAESGMGWAPWALGGGAVLAISGGVAFGLLASSTRDQAARDPFQQSAEQKAANASHYATAANVLYVGGGVLGAAAATWVVLALTSQKSGVHAGVTRLGLGPACVSVGGVFP